MAIEKDGLLAATGGQRERAGKGIRVASGGQKERVTRVYAASGGQRLLVWTANRSGSWTEALTAAESRGPISRFMGGRADAATLGESYTQPTQSEHPPAKTTGVTATALDSDSIRVAWDSMANADTYEVRRDGTVVATGLAGSPWDDNGLAASTQYCYEVRACNTGGCGAWSDTACATTDSGAPDAPTLNSAAFQVGKKTVDLTWSNVSGEDGYNAYYRALGASTWDLLGTAAADATSGSFNNSGFSAATDYEFMVRAEAGGAESADSNVLSATSGSAPAAPTNFVAAWRSLDCKVGLSWDDLPNETSYEIEEDAGSGYTQIATPAQDSTSYVTGTRSADTFYQYRIRGVNDYGSGSWASDSLTTGSCDGGTA